MACRPQSLHGLRPILFAIDEPAQISPAYRGERVFAAARTALGKIPGGRIIIAGTRPADPAHWFERLLKSPAGISWAASKDDDPFLESTWRKSNPSWDAFPELRKAIRTEAQEARNDPLALSMFRSLRLNMGVSEAQDIDNLMDPATWTRCETDDPPDREGQPTWGVDLGGGDAMSAVAAYWPSGRLEARGYFPSNPSLVERGRKHGVGNLYQRMAERGELRTTPGRSVPVDQILSDALQEFGEPRRIACDRWKQNEFWDALGGVGLGHVPIDWRGMGFKDGSQDLRAFMRAVLREEVWTTPSLLLAAAVSNARVRQDDAGNQKLIKSSANSGHLIDSLSASIEAVAAADRNPIQEEVYVFCSFWGWGHPDCLD